MNMIVATSQATGRKYLIDPNKDEFQKELCNVLKQSQNFTMREFQKDQDNEKIWSIYLNAVK